MFYECHTGEKCMWHLVLFKDSSDLSEKLQVIKELFKGTDDLRVMSDK